MKGMENELSHQFQARKQAQEKDRYQEDYKQEVLEDMQQPSEETQYKQLFKQNLLAQLGISSEKILLKKRKRSRSRKSPCRKAAEARNTSRERTAFGQNEGV
ncbi:hypothetical protein AAAC51_26395 [Priestia megaterium]